VADQVDDERLDEIDCQSFAFEKEFNVEKLASVPVARAAQILPA
jgi:hypothetical protein